MKWIAALLASLALAAMAHAELPRFVEKDGVQQLHVDGAPFLILGGELGNSSASSRDYLAPYWERFGALGMNTVLAPVSWELIEPEQGSFDFSSVDWLVEDARAHDMRLVILWFGSWKNSMSSYAPDWVKRNPKRYSRVPGPDGHGQEILSAFDTDTLAADSKAFRMLMKHIAEIDGDRHTVIMVQVENEIGMLPMPREQTKAADKAWKGEVPTALITYLAAHRSRLTPELSALWGANGFRTKGTWADVFGDTPAGEEVFTAWHYAQFANAVAAAGKAELDLPMYVNAALGRPGKQPGEYPSGGPVPHLLDIWKAGAPAIEMRSPDIYFNNYTAIIPRYGRPGNPLFIPEANQAGRAEAPADALLAIGAYGAIGYSPFSIDGIGGEGQARLGEAYHFLATLAPEILAAVRPPADYDGNLDASPQSVTLGGYTFTVTFGSPWVPDDRETPAAYGALILQTGAEDYTILGRGVTITFKPSGKGPAVAGIDRADEMTLVDGQWVPGRCLNGDQTHQGRHILLPIERFSVQKIRLYRYD
ncbi:MAG: DUF5597 domain-containing protein [Hyphomonas sp.]